LPRVGRSLAGHLELTHLQRANLDLRRAQFTDHRIRYREPANAIAPTAATAIASGPIADGPRRRGPTNVGPVTFPLTAGRPVVLVRMLLPAMGCLLLRDLGSIEEDSE
jgi:hypothetical protein